ncbi:hypothetical protein EVAR_81351_1 [Eumeta japonica]|uniref:Uncharacterized protein n=1 Tax=Eumeta variegata TaxID=151549 RepID=A0A4C1X8W1_EUMVA|nr:hypothetical protein EVAR_81351_1 [Eumeta japonica]
MPERCRAQPGNVPSDSKQMLRVGTLSWVQEGSCHKGRDNYIRPKPGRNDYTRPKSYRPIGFLSVLGKIVGKMLMARLNWHLTLTLHGTRYEFMP